MQLFGTVHSSPRDRVRCFRTCFGVFVPACPKSGKECECDTWPWGGTYMDCSVRGLTAVPEGLSETVLEYTSQTCEYITQSQY